MNLIFLDIDGVLNSDEFLQGKNLPLPKDAREHPEHWIDPDAVKCLNRILQKCPGEVQIIVTSSWKSEFSLEQLNEIFRDQGFNGTLDRVMDDHSIEGPSYAVATRIEQIRTELATIRKKEGLEDGLLVLDDYRTDYWWPEDLRGHLVHTDVRYGLRNHHVEEALAKMSRSVCANPMLAEDGRIIEMDPTTWTTILDIVEEKYGAVPVYLFGSRTNPNWEGKGRDYDLLIDAQNAEQSNDVLREQRTPTKIELKDYFGEYDDFDLAVQYGDNPRDFIERNKRTGVRLRSLVGKE